VRAVKISALGGEGVIKGNYWLEPKGILAEKKRNKMKGAKGVLELPFGLVGRKGGILRERDQCAMAGSGKAAERSSG